MGGNYGYMFTHLKKHLLPRKEFHQLAKHLHSIMEEFLPSMVGDRVNEIAKKTVILYVAEGLLLDKQKTQDDVDAMIAEALWKEYKIFKQRLLYKLIMPYQLYQMMKNVKKLQRDYFSIWWSLKIKFDKSAPSNTPCRTAAIRPRDHDDHHDDARSEGENNAKWHKMSE
nr:hypothetical protein [Tanacetum cinerariifolium]